MSADRGDDRDGARYLDRDVFDAPVEVVYRAVPGFPAHRIGSDHSVWWVRPTASGARRRRRVKESRIDGRDGYVRLRHGGRQHVRSIALLWRAAFAPDPGLWLDRIGPRPPRPKPGPVDLPVPVAPDPPPAPVAPVAPSPSEPTIAATIPAAVPRPEVIYRPIPRFPGYRLGIDRSVWSCHDRAGRGGAAWPPAWRRLAATPRPGKGACVFLYRGGRQFVRSVDKLHRTIFPAEEFAPELPAGVAGGGPRGVDNGRAVLSDPEVLEARRLKAEGWTYRQLAARYGVSRSNLWYLLTGKTWGHVAR